MIENQRHAAEAVHFQHIGRAEGNVVVLQHEPPPRVLREPLVRLRPALPRRYSIPVNTTHMDHHHAFRSHLHAVQDLGLAGDIVHALRRQLLTGAIEDDVLRGMKREAQILRSRDLAQLPQFVCTFGHLIAKLRHLRVRQVWRQIRREPVHVDPELL
jgi:hypothetical protein